MTSTEDKLIRARRLAGLLALAHLENNHTATLEVMDEAANTVDFPPLIAALTEGLVEVLVGTAGYDGAVATLNMTINDAEMTALGKESDNG